MVRHLGLYYIARPYRSQPLFAGQRQQRLSRQTHSRLDAGERCAQGVDYYIVFRDTTPAFTPTSGDSIGEATGSDFLDVGAAGTVGTNYYYAVQAVDKAGNKSGYSNQVGEFDKLLGNAK